MEPTVSSELNKMLLQNLQFYHYSIKYYYRIYGFTITHCNAVMKPKVLQLLTKMLLRRPQVYQDSIKCCCGAQSFISTH